MDHANMKKNATPRNTQVNLRLSRRTEYQPYIESHTIVSAQEQVVAGGSNIPSSTRGSTAEKTPRCQPQVKRHNPMMRAYRSCEDECPIVHWRVRREFFDGAVKELINPERHRIDEDENG